MRLSKTDPRSFEITGKRTSELNVELVAAKASVWQEEEAWHASRRYKRTTQGTLRRVGRAQHRAAANTRGRVRVDSC